MKAGAVEGRMKRKIYHKLKRKDQSSEKLYICTKISEVLTDSLCMLNCDGETERK